MGAIEIAFALLPVATGVIGFFGGRYIRGDKLTESLGLTNGILGALAAMRSLGISNEQLEAIKLEFKKRGEIRDIEDRLSAESFNFGAKEIDNATCQQDMNSAQERRLMMLNAKLHSILIELKHYLDPDDYKKLQSAQGAWVRYREFSAQLAGRIFRGGSMEPFRYFGDAFLLTVERLAKLKSDLNSERASFEKQDSAELLQ